MRCSRVLANAATALKILHGVAIRGEAKGALFEESAQTPSILPP